MWQILQGVMKNQTREAALHLIDTYAEGGDGGLGRVVLEALGRVVLVALGGW